MDKNVLPHYGPGPALGAFMFALTAGGIALTKLGKIPKISFGVLEVPAAVAGILLVISGITMYTAALLISKILRSIDDGKLLTTGVYGWTRNPIYSGILFICTGAILIFGNAALIIFPPMMYLAVTAAVKNTEEKWLRKRFGEDYRDYCKRVNRIFPRPARK